MTRNSKRSTAETGKVAQVEKEMKKEEQQEEEEQEEEEQEVLEKSLLVRERTCSQSLHS